MIINVKSQINCSLSAITHPLVNFISCSTQHCSSWCPCCCYMSWCCPIIPLYCPLFVLYLSSIPSSQILLILWSSTSFSLFPQIAQSIWPSLIFHNCHNYHNTLFHIFITSLTVYAFLWGRSTYSVFLYISYINSAYKFLSNWGTFWTKGVFFLFLCKGNCNKYKY